MVGDNYPGIMVHRRGRKETDPKVVRNFYTTGDDDTKNVVGYLLMVIVIALMIVLFWGIKRAYSDEIAIDMNAVIHIESSGDPHSWRQADDSRGLFQITPICLREYNDFHPKGRFSKEDLWDASVSTLIADWYLNVRIPKMLKHYRIPDTVRNRLISYNAGIRYLVKGDPIPQITKDYLKKYARLECQ